MVRQTLTAFTLGPAADPRQYFPVSIALLLLMVCGFIAAWFLRSRTERSTALFVLVVTATAPLAGLVLLSLARPAFHPRYVIAAAPAVLILAAAVPSFAASRGRPLGWAILSGITLFTASWTSAYYHDPRLARDDYRTAAAFVADHAQPEDAVLFNAWYTRFVFDYYFDGPQDRSHVFRTSPMPEDAVVAELNRLSAGHRRLWLVLWQDEAIDPGRHVLAQLESHGTRIAELRLGALRAFGYDLPEGAPFVVEGIQTPMRASLGGMIDLLGYRVSQTAVLPGDGLRVAVYWQARQALPRDYVGFVHLISLSPKPWVHAQEDRPAGGDYYPSTRWQIGQRVRDEYVFSLPQDILPGEYIIETGMYTPGDFARLPTDGDGASPGHDSIFLTERVTVTVR